MTILEFKNLTATLGTEVDFDVNRISKPIVTSETFEEFLAMDKNEQMKLKDQGGFLAAVSRDGSRKKEAIVARTMLALDLDDADVTTLETIKANAFCKLWVHSTRKYTAKKPRYRLIVPLKIPVSCKVYEPLSRFFAQRMNIMEACDPAGFRTAQLMLWPSVSSDMVKSFIFYEAPCEELLNPIDFLAKDEVDNIAKWPRKSEEIKEVVREVKEHSGDDDPRKKVGIVGAFCRAFTIEVAIKRFLEDIYAPSSVDGRFDLIAADSVGGLAIYDGVFAYSFHSSDEASGKLLNAYDLVRIHRFGMLDEEAKPGTPFSRLPSNIAMNKFAMSIPEVMNNVAVEVDEKTEISQDLKNQLKLSSTGIIKNTLANVVTLIQNDEKLTGIVYNSFSEKLAIIKACPWNDTLGDFSDFDMSGLLAYFSKFYNLEVNDRIMTHALRNVKFYRTYHPVKEWLQNLPEWDGVKRLELYLVKYLGAEENDYVRFVSKVILVAAIARVMEPGTKFDIVPVLVGKQGCGKSTVYAKLFGEWFGDSLTLNDVYDKSAMEKIEGTLCMEIAELSGMAKAEVELVKAFISRQSDKGRPAYGRVVKNMKRQCVFVATTNQMDGFLRDPTGNRRFAPVVVSDKSELNPWDMTDEDIIQIWAEALNCYLNKECKLYFDDNIKMVAESEQKAFLVHDERRGLVEAYLAKPIPSNWLKLSEEARIAFLKKGLPVDGLEGTHGEAISRDFHEPFELRNKVSNMEIFVECFGKKPADFNRYKDAPEIAQIMAAIGDWIPSRELFKTPYGKQRYYERTEIQPMRCDK